MTALPSEIDSLYSVAHQGPNYFGPLVLTDLGGLQKYKALHSITTGVPVACAIKGDSGAVFLQVAPIPDAEYALQMQYWTRLAQLSATSPTSRFLNENADIYVYATLVESAPFLKDDSRIQVWKGMLDESLNELDAATQRLTFSGEMTDEPRLVF